MSDFEYIDDEPIRSPWKRFKDEFLGAANANWLGAGLLGRKIAESKYGLTPEQSKEGSRRIAERVDKARQKDDKAFEEMPWYAPAQIGKTAIDLTANILGGVDPTYVLAPGATPVRRIAAQGAINAGADAANQGWQYLDGERDEIDPRSIAINAGAGIVLQGAGEGVARLNRNRADKRLVESTKDADFIMPVQGKVTSGFGQRKAPKAGASTNHMGIDIDAREGTPVQAPATGVVTKVGRGHAKRGNWVEIDHGDGHTTRYLHLSGFNVKPGETIGRGEIFGRVGKTGNVTGAHLHYTVMKDGSPINPLEARFGGGPSRVSDMVETIPNARPFDSRGMSEEDIIEAEAIIRDSDDAEPIRFEDDAIKSDARKEANDYSDEEWARLSNEDKQAALSAENQRLNPERLDRNPLPSPEAVQRAQQMGAKSLDDLSPKEWADLEVEVGKGPKADVIDFHQKQADKIRDQIKKENDEQVKAEDESYWMARTVLDGIRAGNPNAPSLEKIEETLDLAIRGIPYLRGAAKESRIDLIKVLNNAVALKGGKPRPLKASSGTTTPQDYYDMRLNQMLNAANENPDLKKLVQDLKEVDSDYRRYLKDTKDQEGADGYRDSARKMLRDVYGVGKDDEWNDLVAKAERDPVDIPLYGEEEVPKRSLTQLLKDLWNDESGELKGDGDAPEPPKRPGGKKPRAKRARNINLTKLNTTRDIDDALIETARNIPRVERQTHKDIQDVARMLGFNDYEDLIKANPTVNELPGYAVALRNYLVQSAREVVLFGRKVNDKLNVSEQDRVNFRAAVLRHVAIQERASKMAGTAGRLLDSYNIMAKGGKDYAAALKNLPELLQDGQNFDDLADLLAAHGDTPEAVAKAARDALKPKAEDYIFSLRYNMMLSGVKTHLANIFGNTSGLLADIASHGLAALLGQRRRLSENGSRVLGREIVARIAGMAYGARLAFQRVDGNKSQVRLAYELGTPLDLANRTEIRSRSFKGKMGWIEIPTRTLAAEDEFFRSVAYHMELAGQAARQAGDEGLTGREFWDRVDELKANPTKRMDEKAQDAARRMRYQDVPGIAGRTVEWARQVKSGNSATDNALRFALRIAIPFVRTPDSLFRTAIRYSPLGPLDKLNRDDFKAGGARRDVAIGRVALGSSIVYGIAQMAQEGGITGAGPDDPRKRSELLATGWRPYSIKVGDTYYSYERIQPFSLLLGSTATAIEQFQTGGYPDKSFGDKIGRIVMATAGAMVNSAWFESVGDLFDALTNGSAGMANWAAGVASSFTSPAIVRHINEAFIDNKQRVTTGDGSWSDRIVGRVMNGIPGLSDNLPQKHDTLGRPIEKPEALGPDIISPITKSDKDNDPVAQEIARLGIDNKAILVGPPGKTVKVGGFQRNLNAEEFEAYQELSGRYFREGMKIVMEDIEYNMSTDDEQVTIVKKLLKQSRKVAREDLFSQPEEEFSYADEAPEFSYVN